MLLYVWMHLGTSEMVLRALSVLLGAVAVSLFYATSLTLCSRRVVVLGTLLFATSPFLIWYSQEVRYVILMLAMALLSMYVFCQLTQQSRLMVWLAYGGTVILALSSFVANVFIPMAQGLILLWSPSRRPIWRKWIACQLLICALFMWWASDRFLRHMAVEKEVNGEQILSLDPKQLKSGTAKEFTLVAIPYTFFTFSAGFSQGPSVRELHVSRSLATLLPHAPTLVSLGVLFGGLFLVGLFAIWHSPETGKFLTLWLSIPFFGILGISALTSLAFNVRYVGMILPAYVLTLAAGIAWFRHKTVQVILMIAVLSVNGISLANYYFNPQYAREDSRGAVQYLTAAIRSRDSILVIGTDDPLRYYAKDTLPIMEPGTLLKTGHSLTESLQDLVKEHNRLWLVEIRAWRKDQQEVKAALSMKFPLLEHKQLPGVNIYCYDLSR
jgi:uncharacterized membrane protein